MLKTFVSDLHLSPRRPETADLFVDFLAGAARGAAELYILGDLFDYWIGDDNLVDPFNRRVADALAGLSHAGVRIHLMAGNRDFLVGTDFAAAAGLSLLAEPAVIDIGGVPTLLLHGDTLCTDDAEYQKFRLHVRSAAWRDEFLSMPLDERRRKMEGLREQSEQAKQDKDYGLMDANAGAVADAFRRHGVLRMIHGHTHRQARHDLAIDGKPCQRWVLGQWGDRGNALACDGDDWRWLAIPG